jgi:hypothetical protein
MRGLAVLHPGGNSRIHCHAVFDIDIRGSAITLQGSA